MIEAFGRGLARFALGVAAGETTVECAKVLCLGVTAHRRTFDSLGWIAARRRIADVILPRLAEFRLASWGSGGLGRGRFFARMAEW